MNDSLIQPSNRNLSLALFRAQGKPPLHGIPPLRALFLIPKPEHRPQLTSDSGPRLRDFVALCLAKDPAQRPTVTLFLIFKRYNHYYRN